MRLMSLACTTTASEVIKRMKIYVPDFPSQTNWCDDLITYTYLIVLITFSIEYANMNGVTPNDNNGQESSKETLFQLIGK